MSRSKLLWGCTTPTGSSEELPAVPV
uniref:Uncharacterized protein n=1 Tax=Anguilla anguilla TaxID=7936 RepID=A0A0E9QZU0_ANGAN